MSEVEISSNWTCESAESLRNVVTFIHSDNKTCDVENVTPENCVCLKKEDKDDFDSKPELSIKLKHSIKEIKILSEASLIEVFGVYDEYLFTSVPEFMDDWEGMAVYQGKIILPGISSCKLKFSRIKEKGRFWLYNVQLSVVKEVDLSRDLLFNFENINKLINNSSQEVSEKAVRFKKFFELYVKNSKTQPFSVQSLLHIINRECNMQLSDCKRTFTECLRSSNSFLTHNENLTTPRDCNRVKKMELSQECQYLKSYIDGKFVEMQEDIVKSIEIKLDELRIETNTRLDYIIKLLAGSKVSNDLYKFSSASEV